MRRFLWLCAAAAAACGTIAEQGDGGPGGDGSPGGAIDTFILSKPGDPTKETTATFTFYSGATGATFECALGMPYTFTACASPKVYPALGDGRYAFAVRARTATSVDDSPAEAAFTVDTTAPTVTLMGPAEGSTAGRNVTFTYSAEAGASFDCALDSTTLLACFASGKTFELLAGGDHVFRIRATDAVGNVGAVLTRNFKVDAVAPTVTITHFANDQSMVSGTVAFTAGETATFACRLDSGTFAACPASGYAFTNLEPGAHTLAVRATDSAGNTGDVASYLWTVTAPITVVVSHEGAPVQGAAVVFQDGFGAVVASATTDASGMASGVGPAGGMVTAAYQKSGTSYLYTVTGVQPLDSVRVGRHPFTDSYTMMVQTALPAPPAGAASYRQDFGNGISWATATFPGLATFNVSEVSRDSGGKINVLASVTNASGVPIEYGWAAGATVPAMGMGQAVIAAWLEPTTRSISITGIPAGTTELDAEWGISMHQVAYRDDTYFTSDAPGASQSLSVKAPPASAGEGVWVNARLTRAGGEQKIVTSGASVDFATALPFVTLLNLDLSVAARPRVQWNSTAVVDGTVTVLSWGNGGADPDPPHQWHLISASGPSVTTVQAPALPDSLAAYRPRAQNAITILRHTSIESTAFADGGDFRAGWLDLAREGLTRQNQRVPPIPAPTFTTRVTLTTP